MKLKDALRSVLTGEELKLLVRGFDLLGDMAITIIPPELEAKEGLIGSAILGMNNHIRVVAKRAGYYSGEFRTIPLRIIAGEQRKETECREHGVRLRLNPEKVYFSVRSGSERKRLASLVRPGEDVLVMFSGIGASPLIIARLSRAGSVVGVEKNPHAHGYAVLNLAANAGIANVTLLEGDVRNVVPRLGRTFDRVVMPLPAGGEYFLDTALRSLRRNGWLHFYDFQHTGNFADTEKKLQCACEEGNRILVRSQTFSCGHCSPGKYRICVDALIA